MNVERITAIRELQQVLDSQLTSEKPLVLEAGCGSITHVKLPPATQLIGLDISEKQLARNHQLQEKIIGDIQDHDFKGRVFDLVVCWDVLEHVLRPLDAIRNLIKATKPGGILVIAMPNVNSLWGLATKYTPHWLHIFFYRYFLGTKEAGTGDKGPFPTFLKWELAPDSVRSLVLARGCKIAFFKTYDPMLHSLRKRSRMLYFGYVGAAAVLKILSFSRLGGTGNSGLIFVIITPQ